MYFAHEHVNCYSAIIVLTTYFCGCFIFKNYRACSMINALLQKLR
jgi:hypothetical protein